MFSGFVLEVRKEEESYLEVLFLGAEKQRFTAAGDVGHAGHQQE